MKKKLNRPLAVPSSPHFLHILSINKAQGKQQTTFINNYTARNPKTDIRVHQTRSYYPDSVSSSSHSPTPIFINKPLHRPRYLLNPYIRQLYFLPSIAKPCVVAFAPRVSSFLMTVKASFSTHTSLKPNYSEKEIALRHALA
ncbi:hypothetical protein ES332_A11G212200v1 [Gossypium tomentosum]|uniref:Uncharacterized protein n=1 Tax=Gossypium tomentosum TaxID=34277 RepID=A0A5D2NH63_GOSTO|nr:hypothetical protein ES332_A11G212200v1 [Gossypium tomentosum]